MAKLAIALLTLAALSGCYNPRYPSETPAAESRPDQPGNSQETSVRARDRNRDGAAASGSNVGSSAD